MRKWLASAVLVIACGDKRAAPPPTTTPAPSPVAEAATGTRSAVPLPTVAGHGYQPVADTDAITVVVTKTAIHVDGLAIEAIDAGAIAPEAKEGGSLGLVIIRLKGFLEKQAVGSAVKPRVLLLVDPSTRYDLLLQIMFTAKQAGFTDFELAAQVGDKVVSAPIGLATPQAQRPAKPALGVFVTLGREHTTVASTSGLEGTLAKPKASIDTRTQITELGKPIAEIVARRWPAGSGRATEDQTIVIQADAAIPLEWIAHAIGEVRAARDGTPLFPTVRLGVGLE